MKFILLLIIVPLGICFDALGQNREPSKVDVLEKFGFQELVIQVDGDSTFFYYHYKPDAEPITLVLYLQGTSPDPLFSVEKENKKFFTYRWFPGDYKLLDEDYAYVIIAKSGIPAIKRKERSKYDTYHRLNTLDHRVDQADAVINYISEKVIKDVEKVIVFGHSEGAPVAAKLGTVNDKITHLGFWAGNALPDFYDFMLFNSKAVDKGQLSRKEAFKNITEQIETFKDISRNPEDVSYKNKNSYTNKRWWSYAEPPINHLLKIEIPIFVQVAGNDSSAPIESSFIIPLEFTRLGKENLTYNICAECDHSFYTVSEDGKSEDKWSSIFNDFIKWTGSH